MYNLFTYAGRCPAIRLFFGNSILFRESRCPGELAALHVMLALDTERRRWEQKAAKDTKREIG